MSSLRKLQREVIRNQCYRKNGNTKNFKAEWDKVHSKRVETVDVKGNTVVTRKASNKKKRHNDNGKLIVRQLRAMKSFLTGLKEKKAQTDNAVIE